MPRKTKDQLAAEAALANLRCIHDLALESPDGRAVYTRNAGDCTRWCRTLRDTGTAYPPFMYETGLGYFSAIWHLKG